MPYADPEKRRAYRADRRAYEQAYREAHREERRAYGRAHRAEHRTYEQAYRETHREERRAYNAARYAADPEMSAVRTAAQTANRAAKLAGAPGRITATDVLAVWAARQCAYCDGDGIGLDHVLPLSRGGANEPANLVRCCGDCNSRKGRRTPEEWLASAT